MLKVARAMLVVAALVSSARADPRAAASGHVKRGIALYDLGKYDEAIVEFEEAYVLYPTSALLFNLAQAHRKLDHCREALEAYGRFLDRDADSARATEVRALLPDLERACSMKDVDPVGVQAETAPAPPVAVAVAAPSLSPSRVHAWALLAFGTAAGPGGAMSPAGVHAGVTVPVARHGIRVGAVVTATGFGWAASGHRGTTALFGLDAVAGRHVHRGRYAFWGHGGVGVLSVEGLALGHPMLARGRRLSGRAVLPEVRAAIGAERALDVAWSVGVGVTASVSPGLGLGGTFASVEVGLALGYRR